MKELKTFLPLVVVLLVFAIFFSSLGLASSPFNLVWSIFASDYGIVVLGANAAPFFALHLFGRPRRIDTLIVLIAAALFAVLWFALFPFQGAALFRHWYYYSVPGAGLGLASLGCMLLRSRSADVEEQGKNRRLLAAAVLVMGIGLIIEPYLGLTSALHPQTFDAVALHFDATLGFSPSVLVALVAAYLQPLDRVVSIAYNALPYMFCALYALQVTHRQKPPVSFLAVWVLGAAAGFIAYHFLPIAGPKHAFGSQFPAFLPPLSQIPAVEVLVPPAARNGMPSMHFGWALAVWMNACFLGSARLRAFFAVFLALTGLATLALGEHYLIDLVVAVPFMVAVQALATTSIPLGDPAKKRLLIVTGVLVMAWYLAVRWGLGLFTSVPGLTWAFIAATLAATVYVYRPFARRSLTPVLESQSTPAAQAMPRDFLAIAALFVASGFAGLMYEVLFSKALALTFGSTATANYTVLATYMGGMAVGAWLGGKFVALHRRPMLSYALCELVIGLYCVATPAIFAGIRGLYVAMAGDLPPDAGILTLARFTLGALGMVVPTVLMGMTLPILASYFDKRAEPLGRSVAVLYGANTIGAAMGALLTGYWILPAIGVFKTTMMACALNLTVAVIAIELHKRFLPAQGGPIAGDAPPGAAAASVDDRNAGRMALAVLGIGGMVTLALEVIYIHLLAIVAGNSTYAFALMLSTFLIGLALGAGVARRLLMMALSPLALLVCLEFGLALVMLLGLTQWNDLPGYFAGFANYPLARTFGEREFIRGVVCCVAMLPPAFCIGALYPLCMECIGRARPDRKVQWLGTSAAVNTAGNIVGVLVGGFVLLPLLGPLNAVHVLAATCFTLGAIALWVGRRLLAKPLWALPAVVAAVFIFQPSTLDYTELSSGSNVYFVRQGFGQVVDHAESIDGGLTSVARSNDGKKVVLTLLTNGKFQGNNVPQGEMKAQVGFALSPLLHTRQRRDALVIGYGTGVSARALSDAGFARIDVVDLSADIVMLANRHFSDVNANVATRPDVHMHITDGRNYLLLQRRDYDVISMEVSSIWFAGAASLYNREFYQLAKKRLRPSGVLQQWMQFHHISMLDIVMILGSVRAEFDYVWLYLIGGQGMIIASNSPDAFPSRQNAALLDATPTLQDLVKLLDGGAEGVRKELILDPQALDRLLENSRLPLQYRVSTDDNLFLEYSTPKGNALGSNAARDNLDKITRLSRAAE